MVFSKIIRFQPDYFYFYMISYYDINRILSRKECHPEKAADVLVRKKLL
jgi:hypothetical protein